MKSILKMTAIMILLAVLAYVVRYGLNAYLAQYLSAGLYGDFAIAVRLLAVVGVLALFGSNASSKKFLAKYLSIGNQDKAGEYLRWNLRVCFISSFVVLALVCVGAFILFSLHALGIKNITDYHLAVYLVWLAPLLALSFLLISYQSSNHNYILSSMFRGLGKYVLLLGLFVIAISFLDLAINNIFFILIVFFSLLILCSLQLFSMKMASPVLIEDFMHGESIAIDKKLKKAWLKESSSHMLNSVTFLLLCLADILVIEVFAPREAMVGHYAAIVVIASIIWLIPNSMSRFTRPEIESLIAKKNQDKLQTILHKFNRWEFLFAIVTTGVIIGFSGFFLGHFGVGYFDLGLPLSLLALGCLFGSFSKNSAVLLSVAKGKKILFKINFLSLIVTIVLCSVGVYYWGILGVAGASAIAITLRSFVTMWQAKKLTGLKVFLIV